MKLSDDLRRSVLQAAIQGKLTQQYKEDGNVINLLYHIRQEKQKLIKEGKIKKDKPLPAINDSEKPFEIPDNWEWERWGNLSFSIQYGYNTPALKNGKIKIVRISDIQNNRIQWESVPYCEIPEQEISSYLLEKNDILFARTGGTVGKSYLVNEIPEEAIYAGYLIRTRFSSRINPQFIKYFMESNLYWVQLRNGTVATAQPNCNGQTLSKMILPIPPLAEQKRIVERVETIMKKIDELDKAETELEAFKKKFPDDMRNSLLQAAIQGKLTQQFKEDGNVKNLLYHIRQEKQKLIKKGKIKKDKPLPAIDDSEKPFEIPDNWEWVRLRDICSKIVDGDHTPPTGLKEKTEYLMLSALNVNNNSLVNLEKVRYLSKENFDLEQKRINLNIGDILFTIVGTLGRSCIYGGGMNICFQRSVSILTTMINPYFLKLALDAPNIQSYMVKNSTGTAQKGFYLNQVAELLIPLPPLAEQERIVKRLNELLPLCEAMKGE